jgi:hypothetical protein
VGVITIKQAKKDVRWALKIITIRKKKNVLPFKTMAIMTSCWFFIHMNIKENSNQKFI